MDRNRIKQEWLTIPNLLSLFRLVLIPVYVLIYQNARDWKDHILAAVILAVSCLTDMIDGKIARKFHMTSTVGKVLDPLADKATQLTLILCLAYKYDIIQYLVIFFLVKELFQLIAAVINWHKGRILKEALFSGKLCTTILFVSLIIMVLIPQIPANIVNIITLIDIFFVLASFVDYLFTYLFSSSRFEPLQDKK